MDMHLGTPAHDRLEGELHWLGLLDQLYALVETEGAEASLSGVRGGWPELWQPVVQRWASRIGARSIQISEPLALQSPGCEPGFLSHRRITGQVISACSAAPDGFTAEQAREIQVYCSHLHTAWALRASLDATQASLVALYGVIDALPSAIVVLDEHAEVALLNRRSHEWLAGTGCASLQSRRLRLRAQQEAFDRALHAVMSGASAAQALQLHTLDIRVQKLACSPVSVLVLIHERCDPARLRESAALPAPLAQLLQRRHALTDKELPLAWNLAQGVPLKQYAAFSGRSIETVRAQLKSVFRKLGVADQKGLGLVLFEALHALTLQVMGTSLASLIGEHAAPGPQALKTLPWR